MFRVGHVHEDARPNDVIINIIKKLNKNLILIKRRHDELNNENNNTDDSLIIEDDDDELKNSIVETKDNDNNENYDEQITLGLSLKNLPSTPTKKLSTKSSNKSNEFEFELQSSPESISNNNNNNNNQHQTTSSQHSSPSNKTSKRLSKRNLKLSLLPKPALNLLLNFSNDFEIDNNNENDHFNFDKHLDIYAIKSLSEYENIINVEYQYQDWQQRLVPRLAVQWPAVFTFD